MFCPIKACSVDVTVGKAKFRFDKWHSFRLVKKTLLKPVRGSGRSQAVEFIDEVKPMVWPHVEEVEIDYACRKIGYRHEHRRSGLVHVPEIVSGDSRRL